MLQIVMEMRVQVLKRQDNQVKNMPRPRTGLAGNHNSQRTLQGSMHIPRNTLPASLVAWSTPAFEAIFKEEMCKLDREMLPLQAALSQSSYVSERAIEPVILRSSETADEIQVKTGIFYAGIIAGSCCADDPSPNCEQAEYCELLITINKITAQVEITLF
jgi:hypothetical protein